MQLTKAKEDSQTLSIGFFDDPTKPAHIWQKPTLNDVFKPGVSDIFFKKKSKLNDFQKRYYTLTKECLYYRKVYFFFYFFGIYLRLKNQWNNLFFMYFINVGRKIR